MKKLVRQTPDQAAREFNREPAVPTTQPPASRAGKPPRSPFLLKTTDESVPLAPVNGTDFKLAELQAAVGGDIQVVTLPEGMIMVLNEYGKMLGLPKNDLASLRGWLDDSIFDWDHINGDVLICPSAMVK